MREISCWEISQNFIGYLIDKDQWTKLMHTKQKKTNELIKDEMMDCLGHLWLMRFIDTKKCQNCTDSCIMLYETK